MISLRHNNVARSRLLFFHFISRYVFPGEHLKRHGYNELGVRKLLSLASAGKKDGSVALIRAYVVQYEIVECTRKTDTVKRVTIVTKTAFTVRYTSSFIDDQSIA